MTVYLSISESFPAEDSDSTICPVSEMWVRRYVGILFVLHLFSLLGIAHQGQQNLPEINM